MISEETTARMEILNAQTNRYDRLKKRINDASSIENNDQSNLNPQPTRELLYQLEKEYIRVVKHWNGQEPSPYANVVNTSTSPYLQNLNEALLKQAASHLVAMEADIRMNSKKIAKLLAGDKS